MSKTLFRTRRGVTFIELIGVLVVAIIIIAGALALYSEANTSSRTNQLLVAVGALTGSVRALHANTANYGGSLDSSDSSVDTGVTLTTVLVNANAVPPGLLIQNISTTVTTTPVGGGAATTTTTTAPQINHAFGGKVDVIGFGQLFAITAESLDQDICIRVSTESTAKASSGLRGVFVGNSQSTAADAASEVTKISETGGTPAAVVDTAGATAGVFVSGTLTTGGLPIAPTDADAACDDASDNMIAWVFQ